MPPISPAHRTGRFKGGQGCVMEPPMPTDNSRGGDVLAAEPQPLVEGDHAGGLQILLSP